MGAGWWLEDAVPGTVLRHRGGRTIDAAEHVLLAWMTDNQSDVHGNVDRASRGAFGGAVVLGALSVAIVAGLAGAAAPRPERIARGLPTGWRRIALVGAVVPGDTLAAESEVAAVIPDADGAGGIIERTVVGRNQRGEAVVRIEERCWAPARAAAETRARAGLSGAAGGDPASPAQ